MFENIAGRRALLVGGHRPLWVLSERDTFRAHPMALAPPAPPAPAPGAGTGAEDEDRDDLFLDPAWAALPVINAATGTAVSTPPPPLEGGGGAAEDGGLSDEEVRTRKPGVSCATAFHNVNCDHGFIYFDMRGQLNISTLPAPAPLQLPSTASVSGLTAEQKEKHEKETGIHLL
jgi:hypothetical protein